MEKIITQAHSNWRKFFPAVCNHPEEIYFDSAATTHKPQQVIDALTHFYADSYGTINRSLYPRGQKVSQKYHEVREKLASFLHMPSEGQIIFTTGATASLNLLAAGYAQTVLKPGDRILLPVTEHHANFVPWQHWCQVVGAYIEFIPLDEQGRLDLNFLEKNLTPTTRLISLAHISNVTGVLHPIEEVVKLAHARGVHVALDAAQSIAHLPIDLKALGVDFLAASAHKMLAPTGAGFLYGRQDLLQKFPPLLFGGDMIEQVGFDKTTYQPSPQRFEAGTPPIASIIAWGVALDLIQEWDRGSIHKYEMELMRQLLYELSTVPSLHVVLPHQEKSSIVSFTIDQIHPMDLALLLGEKGIAIRSGHLCSQPSMATLGIGAVSRISLALYNNPDEITRFAQALRETIAILK